MCASAFTAFFVSAVNNSFNVVVSVGAKLAVRYYAQSPARTALSVATAVCREGIRLKVNAYVNKKWKEKRKGITNRLKVALGRTIKWPRRMIKRNEANFISKENEAVAIDAALRYQKIAQQRFERARDAFKYAEMELREAEDAFDEANAFVKSVHLSCRSTPETRQCRSSSDIVFVVYPEWNEAQ